MDNASSRDGKTAEGEEFEPPGTCIPRLFKSDSGDRPNRLQAVCDQDFLR
jgi:hypothetical protein